MVNGMMWTLLNLILADIRLLLKCKVKKDYQEKNLFIYRLKIEIVLQSILIMVNNTNYGLGKNYLGLLRSAL